MATPFIDEVFTFTQPDGSEITLRGTGNQYQARFETLDGVPVAQDPATGFYHVAVAAFDGFERLPSEFRADMPRAELLEEGIDLESRLPPQRSILPTGGTRWAERLAERRSEVAVFESLPGIVAAPPRRRVWGDIVGLTVLVDFSDFPSSIDPAEVDRFCNQHAYSGFGNNGSVHDYFVDVSGGQLTYTNIVLPYYRASNPRTYYTDRNVPYGQRARELIREVIDHHRSNGFDFSGLSTDDQGYVYALNIFYAGVRSNNWSEGLWPHQSGLQQAITVAPGFAFKDYQITDMGNLLTLGTFCHENGHMVCDFPDLYDYDEKSVGFGTGVFCLMCAGGTGNGNRNPAQVGAYLKAAAGWCRVTPAAVGNVTIDASVNDVVRIDRSATEYFLIENRVRTGRDAVLPAQGLAVWHVDERGSNSNQEMRPDKHYECALVQADGLFQLERAQNYGDAFDLFAAGGRDRLDADTPGYRWWDGASVGSSIDSVGVAGGPTISFRIS